jgi:hypothetical protein
MGQFSMPKNTMDVISEYLTQQAKIDPLTVRPQRFETIIHLLTLGLNNIKSRVNGK